MIPVSGKSAVRPFFRTEICGHLPCGGKRSIGTQCPMDICGQFYAEQMSVGKNIPILCKPLQISMGTSATFHADVRRPPCRRPQASVRTSAGPHADVRRLPCRCPHATMWTSAGLQEDIRRPPCRCQHVSLVDVRRPPCRCPHVSLRMSVGLPADVCMSSCGNCLYQHVSLQMYADICRVKSLEKCAVIF